MGARTVLVVDSSPLTARRAEEALRDTGFKTVIATTQSEAEAVAASEEIAVLVTSLVFPNGNGYELGKQVRAQHPEAVVFLLCGPFEVYSQERARQAGIQERITRPFTVDTFRRQLEAVLGPLGEPPEPTPTPPRPMEKARPVPPVAVPVVRPEAPAPVVAVAVPMETPHVPAEEERLASFIPRQYQRAPATAVDPSLIPVVERVVQEVLPEVVEAILNQALHRSRAFKELIQATVQMAIAERLPAIAMEAVQQRLSELEAQAAPESAPPEQTLGESGK